MCHFAQSAAILRIIVNTNYSECEYRVQLSNIHIVTRVQKKVLKAKN